MSVCCMCDLCVRLYCVQAVTPPPCYIRSTEEWMAIQLIVILITISRLFLVSACTVSCLASCCCQVWVVQSQLGNTPPPAAAYTHSVADATFAIKQQVCSVVQAVMPLRRQVCIQVVVVHFAEMLCPVAALQAAMFVFACTMCTDVSHLHCL